MWFPNMEELDTRDAGLFLMLLLVYACDDLYHFDRYLVRLFTTLTLIASVPILAARVHPQEQIIPCAPHQDVRWQTFGGFRA